jgi:hypothetical protein
MKISRSQCKAFSAELPIGDPTSGPQYKFGAPKARTYQDPITFFAATEAAGAAAAVTSVEASMIAGLEASTLGTSMAAPSLFTASNLSMASNAFSAISSIQQGAAQGDYYRLQGAQAELQGRQNALNYNRQAYQLLERQQRLAGTVRARAVAGGVDPLSGSPMTVEQANAYRAGNEIQILNENAQLAMSGGLAISQSFNAAASSAEEYGLMSGIAKGALGVATYMGTKTPIPKRA